MQAHAHINPQKCLHVHKQSAALLIKAGTRANDEESVHFVFHPNLFQVHLFSSLTRQTKLVIQAFFKEVPDALFHAASLWLEVPAAFCCALMILADDTVLNISASSAEARVHSERQRSIHRATKKPPQKGKEIYFHGHCS